MYEEISVTRPVARKEHRCLWCPEKIQKGEQYVRDVCRWEGDFQCNNYHTDCWQAMAKSEDACEGFEPHSHKRGTAEESFAEI